MKFAPSCGYGSCGSRAPQGARGLKCPDPDDEGGYIVVAPRKGRVG